MQNKNRNPNLLTSWKEIAAYLDCDLRTAHRWETKSGLPVYRADKTSKSRVFAYASELEEWIRNGVTNRAVQKGKNSRGINWKRNIPILVSCLVLIAIYFLYVTPALGSLEPARFSIQGSVFIVLNQNGKELWRYDTGLEKLCGEKEYGEHFQLKTRPGKETPLPNLPYLIIKDLNNDRHKEVLFSTHTQDRQGEGELYCFDYRGHRLWPFKCNREIKANNIVYPAEYIIRGFDVCDLNNDGLLETVVLSQHSVQWPTQMAVISVSGKIVGEYWNSGHLADMTFVDLNNDGHKEIVVAGLNNEYAKGCLIIFDSSVVEGSSPNSAGFKCEALKPGSEIYYILFPRTDVDLLEWPMESLSAVSVLAGSRLSVVANTSRLNYEFNFNLELQYFQFNHYFEQLHDAARRAGKLVSELNEGYRKKIIYGILYSDGNKWVSRPTISHH